MSLDLVHDAQDLGDLGVERRRSAEEDVAVRMGGIALVLSFKLIGTNGLTSNYFKL